MNSCHLLHKYVFMYFANPVPQSYVSHAVSSKLWSEGDGPPVTVIILEGVLSQVGALRTRDSGSGAATARPHTNSCQVPSARWCLAAGWTFTLHLIWDSAITSDIPSPAHQLTSSSTIGPRPGNLRNNRLCTAIAQSTSQRHHAHVHVISDCSTRCQPLLPPQLPLRPPLI
jgi:hypothetical protein